MKLLIMTQAVDRTHPILGFFHGWVEEFGKQCERVTIIGQQVGSHAFPSHVHVASLHKETGAHVVSQILRFWMLQWRLRHTYDCMLVHMTPVWVVLGRPLACFLRKPIFLWYEVRRGGWMLKMALLLSRRVFSATQDGVPFASRKHIVLGHGIDTAQFEFASPEERDPYLLVAVGRITPIKRIELFLDLLAALPAPYRLELIGTTMTERDRRYMKILQERAHVHGLQERWSIRSLPHAELPAVLRRAALFVHAGGGGLDKALLEAMACGCTVLSASNIASALLPFDCTAQPENFAERAKALLARPWPERQAIGVALRGIVEREHSLPALIGRMTAEMQAAR